MSPKPGASQEILVLMISILTPVPIAQHYGTFFTALEHPTSPLSLVYYLVMVCWFLTLYRQSCSTSKAVTVNY